MTDTREFTDADGIAIVYDVHPATTTPRGVVQLLHGVGEHAGRYGALIGSITAPVAIGEHIHTHNLESDYIPTFTLGQDGHHFLDKDAKQ